MQASALGFRWIARRGRICWIRAEFLNSRALLDKVVVHGHSPTDLPIQRSNRIGIDTGAYATGHLTTVVLEGQGCRF